MLYDYESSLFMLGCFANNPNLLVKYPMCKQDFEEVLFHKIVYVTMKNLFNEGVTEIDDIVIQQWLEKYPSQLEVVRDNNIYEFLENSKSVSKVGNAEYYYLKIRKFGALRKFQKLGLDITEKYDESKDEIEQRKKLDGIKLEELVNYFESKLYEIRKEYVKSTNEEKQGGVGTLEMIDSFIDSPRFGASLQSEILTSVAMGWLQGHVICESAPSGFGKSQKLVADLCVVCCDEIYNETTRQYEPNPRKVATGGLYILSEMKIKEELEPMFVSFISAVTRNKILKGKYDTIDEYERVKRACQIFKDANIHLVNMPDFTITKIKASTKEYVEQKNVTHMAFDYVTNNGIVGGEIAKMSGVVQREDMILLALMSALKLMAEDLNVAVRTATQLNGNEKLVERLDESCIAGSKAMKNKLDVGVIDYFPRKKELEECQALINKFTEFKGFGDKIYPNNICHVYKGRFSEYGEVKIWQYFNKGNCRTIDIFATDFNNSFADIERTIVNAKELEEQPIQ